MCLKKTYSVKLSADRHGHLTDLQNLPSYCTIPLVLQACRWRAAKPVPAALSIRQSSQPIMLSSCRNSPTLAVQLLFEVYSPLLSLNCGY